MSQLMETTQYLTVLTPVPWPLLNCRKCSTLFLKRKKENTLSEVPTDYNKPHQLVVDTLTFAGLPNFTFPPLQCIFHLTGWSPSHPLHLLGPSAWNSFLPGIPKPHIF